MPRIDPSERGKCQKCGEKIAGNKFYCDAHRPEKAPRKPPQRTKKAVETVQAEPVTAIATAVADAGAGIRPSKKGPTADQTAKVLGRVLVYISALLVMSLIANDPDVGSEEDYEALAASLTLTDSQAVAIMHPVSRILTPTAMWQKYGGTVIENSDILESIVAVYDYMSGLVRYKRERARREALRRGQIAQPAPPPMNGHAVIAPSPEVVTHAQRMTEGERQNPAYDPTAPRGYEQGVKVSRSMLRGDQ